MNKNTYTVLGIMSGTSVDGMDISLLQTDGIDKVKNICGCTYKYDENYRNLLKKFIKKININNFSQTKEIDKIVSKKFLTLINKFIKDYKIKKNSIDYIGLSGQTILHKPEIKKSIQLGSGEFIAKKLKIKVISNFRDNDIKNGGQGAPIASTYNHYISKKFKKNLVFINLGGIANIFFSKNNKLIAFDTGPANSLLDDLIYLKLNKRYDYNGRISAKGKLNIKILNKFLQDKYFKIKYPKSLDREYFKKYINKIKHLKIENAAHTLSMMTVHSIILGIKLLNENIDEIILTGGGRKNLFIFNKLSKLSNTKIINIDDLGFNGDLLEAQAFGFLAVRSIKNLPLSFKTTTGCIKNVSGGITYDFN